MRAVIESAEGNAADIRRRAREDAELLDNERAEVAGRLSTQMGELEGSFSAFGDRLGREGLPSGEIRGELGAAASSEASEADRGGSPTAWRAPAETTSEPDAGAEAEADDEGLLGGLRRRFGTTEESQETAVPPQAAESEEWLPESGEEGGADQPEVSAEPDEEPPPTDAADWEVAPDQSGEGAQDAAAGAEEPEASAEAPSEDFTEPEQTAAEPSTGPGPGPIQPGPSQKPRGRIARLLLGRRAGE